jgi:hypothetical protein
MSDHHPGNGPSDNGPPASGSPNDGSATPLSNGDDAQVGGVLVKRPWLPVTIAVVVAALILLFFIIPGILLYPEREGLFASSEEDLNAQREINRSIEEQITRLRRELDEGVCVWDGQFWTQPPPPYPNDIPPPPQPSQSLPPPSVGATELQESSLPPDVNFDGTLLELLDQATVLVLAVTDEGVMTGTGFIVAPGKILTNNHVVGGNAATKVAIANRAIGEVVEARISAMTPSSDIGGLDYAILDADTGNLPYLAFQPNVTRLEDVIAAGFPGFILDTDDAYLRLMQGDFRSIPAAAVTEGNVNAIQSGTNVQIILHSAQITPGNSGGPLLDRCGRVLAVNTFVRSEETSARLNYALDADSAIAFLRQNGIQPHVETNACVAPTPSSPIGPNQAEADGGEEGQSEAPATGEAN